MINYNKPVGESGTHILKGLTQLITNPSTPLVCRSTTLYCLLFNGGLSFGGENGTKWSDLNGGNHYV